MTDAVGRFPGVLVLGANSDIARATTRALAARGTTRFALAARHEGSAKVHADELIAQGAERAEVIAFDANDLGSHADVIARAVDALGDIDVAVIAFGVLGDQGTFDADPRAGAEAALTNYTAVVSAGLHVAKRMVEQGRGKIVVLSSVAGVRVRKVHPVYGSAKAGVDGFALAMADRLEGTGVDVVVVRPGFVATKMTAGMKSAPFSTTPEAVAAATVDALVKERSVVWVPGVLRLVFTAIRLLPRAVFKRLPF